MNMTGRGMSARSDRRRQARAAHVERVARQSREEWTLTLGGRTSLRRARELKSKAADIVKARAEMLAPRTWA